MPAAACPSSCAVLTPVCCHPSILVPGSGTGPPSPFPATLLPPPPPISAQVSVRAAARDIGMAAIRSARAARAVQEALAAERKGLAAGLAARRPAADIAAGGYVGGRGGAIGAAGAAGSCAGLQCIDTRLWALLCLRLVGQGAG
jgi:hypothetical protein